MKKTLRTQPTKKSLKLDTETLRTLRDGQLEQVGGGMTGTMIGCDQTTSVPVTFCL